MPVLNRFADLYDEIAAWRHDIHQHPELGFDVQRTAGIVEAKLKEFGCDEVATGIGKTGVVGVIRGKGQSSGRAIGLRADMDALPIPERTGADYASIYPEKMHACGHDGHTAMLLGAAKYLAETRNFDGNVVLIFQPAEEAGGGGEVMVQDGMMERFGIQQVFGMHNAPGLPVGQFAIRSGPSLAATDEFTIRFVGRGSHAARPHQSVDPTQIAAGFVIQAQSVVARNVDPIETMAVSVTTLRTENDTVNVIPASATILGTVRCFTEENRSLAVARLTAIAEGVAAAYGGTAEIEWERGYPPMVNHKEEAEFCAEIADEIAGGCIRNTPPIMAAEDFSYMLNARPGAMISIGNGPSAECHHPAFDFADESIPAGCSYWVRLAERAMPLKD